MGRKRVNTVPQDLKRETKVLTNSAKTGYQKRPRQLYGPDYIEILPTPKAVEIPV